MMIVSYIILKGVLLLLIVKIHFHAAVVEIYVGKNSKCRYTTIQNWAPNVYNLVTKRALVDTNGTMEWIDGNIGSKLTMKYPLLYLKKVIIVEVLVLLFLSKF